MISFKVHEFIPLNTNFEFEWVTLLTSVGCQKGHMPRTVQDNMWHHYNFLAPIETAQLSPQNHEVQENQVFEEKKFSKPGNSLYLCKNVNPLIFLAFSDQCKRWENLNLVHIAVQAPDCQVHETWPGDLSVSRNVTGQEQQQQQTHVAELFSGRESCEFKDMHW